MDAGNGDYFQKRFSVFSCKNFILFSVNIFVNKFLLEPLNCMTLGLLMCPHCKSGPDLPTRD